MNLFERYGQVDSRNELWLKEKYDALMSAGTPGYCLVALTLKDFLRYSHLLGHEESEKALHSCFDLLAGCLVEGEYVVRVHSWHFALLVKCTPDEAGLHPNAQRFHFAIRDGMMERYGRSLDALDRPREGDDSLGGFSARNRGERNCSGCGPLPIRYGLRLPG